MRFLSLTFSIISWAWSRPFIVMLQGFIPTSTLLIYHFFMRLLVLSFENHFIHIDVSANQLGGLKICYWKVFFISLLRATWYTVQFKAVMAIDFRKPITWIFFELNQPKSLLRTLSFSTVGLVSMPGSLSFFSWLKSETRTIFQIL